MRNCGVATKLRSRQRQRECRWQTGCSHNNRLPVEHVETDEKGAFAWREEMSPAPGRAANHQAGRSYQVAVRARKLQKRKKE
jgi:hypothetical protein